MYIQVYVKIKRKKEEKTPNTYWYLFMCTLSLGDIYRYIIMNYVIRFR